MGASVRVDTSSLLKGIRDVKVAVSNWTPALSEWGRGTGAAKREAWKKMLYRKLYASPQLFEEGVVWKKIPPYYIRKGTPDIRGKRIGSGMQAISPFGNTNLRIAHGFEQSGSDIQTKRAIYRRMVGTVRGFVAAKKRPSGQPVTLNSIVGQDTGKMMREFTTRFLISENKRSVKLYTTVKYGDAQNKLRPFNLLGPDDEKRLLVAADRQVNKAAQKMRGL